jgi:hypothetical protein
VTACSVREESEMKAPYVIALAMLTGVVIGTLGGRVLMAQKPPTPKSHWWCQTFRGHG